MIMDSKCCVGLYKELVYYVYYITKTWTIKSQRETCKPYCGRTYDAFIIQMFQTLYGEIEETMKH
jgi:hypothetical protein